MAKEWALEVTLEEADKATMLHTIAMTSQVAAEADKSTAGWKPCWM